MSKAEELLLQMENVLDEMIQNAQRLVETSSQVISEQELDPLQRKQEELVTALKKLDDDFKVALKKTPSATDSTEHAKIEQKLKNFQQLNAKFIENLNASQGLIRFELGKKSMKKKS